jgi:hypothetical protein
MRGEVALDRLGANDDHRRIEWSLGRRRCKAYLVSVKRDMKMPRCVIFRRLRSTS